MMLRLVAVILLWSMTVGCVDGLQCVQCTYFDNLFGTGLSCITANETFTDTVDCTTSCYLSVTLTGDNQVFTLSRGCTASSKIVSCCENQNSHMKCTTVCDDVDLCNNSPYDYSSINSQTRCEAPEVAGFIPCNSCLYNKGFPDASCLDSPLTGRVGFVLCDTSSQHCYTRSERDNANLSDVWSYARGCATIGSQAYGVTVGSDRTTWICHCETAYCNDNTVDGTQAECDPRNGTIDGGINGSTTEDGGFPIRGSTTVDGGIIGVEPTYGVNRGVSPKRVHCYLLVILSVSLSLIVAALLAQLQ